MDFDDLKVADEIEVAHQNGVHKQLVASEEDGFAGDDVNGTFEKSTETERPNGDSESVDKQDESGTTGEVREGANDIVESNGSTTAKV